MDGGLRAGLVSGTEAIVGSNLMRDKSQGK
jgi:hypothetical protein